MGARLAGCALALGLLVGVTPAAAKCELQKYVELPVTIQNGGAVVDAKINGADAKLTVDTGAFFSVLYPSTITKFGLNTEPLPSYLRVMRAATGDADFKLTTVKQLTVLGVALNKVQFLVSEHGLFETDGLLGQNLLSLMDTEFDLSDGAIRLLKPVGCGDAALAYWDTGATDSRTYGMMSIDPIAPPDQAIIGTVTINGVKVRAIFDTGATRSMLTLAAAQRADVRTTDPGVVAGGSVGAFGRGQVETWIAPFSLVDFGGEQIKNTRLRIAELHLPYDADMVIGADFFLSHRVYVAKSQNKLYFTYNGGPVFNLDLQSPAGARGAGADNHGGGCRCAVARADGRRGLQPPRRGLRRARRVRPGDRGLRPRRHPRAQRWALLRPRNGAAAQPCADPGAFKLRSGAEAQARLRAGAVGARRTADEPEEL
jgi:predicted aspartyl protease